MAYVRKVRTGSGAVAVQVARKVRGRVVVLAHVGSAHSDAELGILLDKAQQILHGEQQSLPILREIKGDETLKGIPVVMTSGLDHSQECEKAGADGFIIKPFRPAPLLEEIRAILKK